MKMKAFGLIEMILVLALCAVILLVSVHYYSEVKNTQRINAMVQQIQDVVNASNQCILGGGVTGSYSSYGQPIGLANKNCANITTLISAGSLASSYQTNPWGSENAFQIYYNNTAYQFVACGVPKDSCYAVGSRLAGVLPNSQSQFNKSSSNRCNSEQSVANCFFIIPIPGQTLNMN